jgi:pimeloyl-ACP methyl ester carboxylesterase
MMASRSSAISSFRPGAAPRRSCATPTRSSAAIAPPLGHITAEPGVAVPTLVLTPAHDQFAPPEVARPIVESWADAEFEVIDMADHFIADRSDAVAARAATWVSDRWPPRSPL